MSAIPAASQYCRSTASVARPISLLATRGALSSGSNARSNAVSHAGHISGPASSRL